jgi:hypothetical protein
VVPNKVIDVFNIRIGKQKEKENMLKNIMSEIKAMEERINKKEEEMMNEKQEIEMVKE